MHLSALLMLIAVVIIPDIWFTYRMRHHRLHWTFHALYWLTSLLFLLTFIFLRTHADDIKDPSLSVKVIWFLSVFALIYAPKLIFTLFNQLNCLLNYFTKQKSRIITYVGGVLSLLTFCLLLVGSTHTRKHLLVKEIELTLPNLPAQFDGLRIAHITDQHLGNWGQDTSFVAHVVNTINQQHPDVICSTGDMVNNFACELPPYITIWQRLYAPLGKFAVLGNHDYGDYTQWESIEARHANLEATKQYIRDCGFELLLNEHIYISKNTDTLYIAGVENWGKPPFPQYGDLSKAMHNIPENAFTLLLSHDVSHWKQEVVGRPNIPLTLSGHTHAAQVGLTTPRIRLSPASWIYDEWAGLYEEQNQYLHVNPGLGYIGIAIRIGIRPEITLITLRKGI